MKKIVFVLLCGLTVMSLVSGCGISAASTEQAASDGTEEVYSEEEYVQADFY